MADNALQVTISASIQGLIDGMRDATTAVRDSTKSITSMIEGLVDTFENIKAPITAALGVFGGGALFKGMMDGTDDYIHSVQKLAIILGTSKEEASAYSYALGRLGVSSDMFSTTVFKLQTMLRTNEAALIANGVATRGFGGAHRAVLDVMSDGLKRINEMKAGYDANALAQMMFGRGASELTDIQRLTNEALAGGAEAAQKLGLVVTDESTGAMWKYRAAMFDLGQVFEAIKIQIGTQLMPVLTSLGNWFASIAPPIISAVVAVFKGLEAVLTSTTAMLAITGLALSRPLMAIGGAISGFAATYSATLVNLVRSCDNTFISMGERISIFGSQFKAQFAGLISAVVNPFTIITAIILGEVYAFERFLTVQRRVADNFKEMAATVKSQTDEYTRLTAKAVELNEVAERDGEVTSDVQKAKNQLSLVIEQLNTLYPGFNKFLVDEAGNHVAIAVAIERANKARSADIAVKLAEAEAQLKKIEAAKAEFDALQAQIDQAPKNSSALKSTGDAQVETSRMLTKGYSDLAAGVLNWMGFTSPAAVKAGDFTKALSTQREAILTLRGSLLALSGDIDTTTKPRTGEFIDPKSAGRYPLWQQELEKLKSLEENWFTWSNGRELAFWQEKLKLTQVGGKEWEDVLKQVNVYRKKIIEDEHNALLQGLQAQLQESRKQGQARIEVAEAMVREELRVHTAGSAQVAAALKRLSEVRFKVHQDDLAAERAYHQGVRDMQKVGVELQIADVQLSAKLGTINRQQEIAELHKFITQKWELQHAGYIEELSNTQLTETQKAELRNKDLIAYGNYILEMRKLNAEFQQDQQRQANLFINPLVSAYESAFESMADVIFKHHKTLADSIRDLWQGVFRAMVKGFADLTGEWISQGLKILSQFIIQKTQELLFHKKVEEEKAKDTVLSAGTQAAANKEVAAMEQEHQLKPPEMLSLGKEGGSATAPAVPTGVSSETGPVTASGPITATGPITHTGPSAPTAPLPGAMTNTPAVPTSIPMREPGGQLAPPAPKLEDINVTKQATEAEVDHTRALTEGMTAQEAIVPIEKAKYDVDLLGTTATRESTTAETGKTAAISTSIGAKSAATAAEQTKTLVTAVGAQANTVAASTESARGTAAVSAATQENAATASSIAMKSTELGVSLTEASTEVGANAAVAASGAAASAASTPATGWIIAIPAMAAVLGAVLALRGQIGHAAGGWDIPAGSNPLGQLHAKEMVLPAHLADRVRGMTEPNNGGGDTHVHVHVPSVVDGDHFRDTLDRNIHHLVSAIADAQRKGRM